MKSQFLVLLTGLGISTASLASTATKATAEMTKIFCQFNGQPSNSISIYAGPFTSVNGILSDSQAKATVTLKSAHASAAYPAIVIREAVSTRLVFGHGYKADLGKAGSFDIQHVHDTSSWGEPKAPKFGGYYEQNGQTYWLDCNYVP